MSVIDKIRAKAAADVKHVVLAEGTEPRTVQAAEKIVKLGLAKITLVGAKAEIEAKAETLAVGKAGMAGAKCFVLAMLAGVFIAFGATYFLVFLGDSAVPFAAASPPSSGSSFSSLRAMERIVSPLSGLAKVTPWVLRPVRLTSSTLERITLPDFMMAIT